MQALLFDPSASRLPVAGLASRIRPDLALRWRSPLSLRELPEPASPGADWVRLRVLRTGICGSDVKEALLQASSDNPLSGLISFPHVPGHEILAEVATGHGSAGLADGTRIAVDPWLGCVARGLLNLCPACSAGFPPHCANVLNGGPWGTGRGMHLGTVRDLPGGFAQIIQAHSSQLHPIPDGLPLELVVLADPLAVALHAVSQLPGQPEGPVLVLGAGTIGLSLALACRERWPKSEIMVTAAWENQVELVRAMGAEPLAPDAAGVVPEMARRGGGRLARPWRGGSWAVGGGGSVVFDSIGSAATTELALRALAPRGQLVTVGVGRPARTETTLTYYKEVRVLGSNGYGMSAQGSKPRHLLDCALELLEKNSDLASGWVTHSLPLSRWQEAFAAAARPDHSRSIKVSLRLWED